MITSQTQYESFLKAFKKELIQRLPPEENAAVSLLQADTGALMQYGSSCVLARLTTETSGVDDYLIWVEKGDMRFIRNIELH
jgi:hypothetical protein